MQRILILFTLTLLHLVPVQAIVYINRNSIGSIVPYSIASPETWDENTQNAYGTLNSLPPGPPFIIEHNVIVNSTLTIDPIGSGDTLTVGGTIVVDNKGHVSVEGMYIFLAATWQVRDTSSLSIDRCDIYSPPAPSQGRVLVQSGSSISVHHTTATTDYGILFTLTDYNQASFVADTIHSTNNLISFNYMIQARGADYSNMGTILVDSSQFWSTGGIEHTLFYIVYSYATITDNAFLGGDGTGLRLANVEELVLQDNRFEDFTCSTSWAYCGVPLLILEVGMWDIRRNTGINNDKNYMYNFNYTLMASAGDTARLKTESGFPLVSTGDLESDTNRVFIIEPNSVLKFGKTSSDIRVHGRLEAKQVIFTSTKDSTAGGKTDPSGPSPGDWHELYLLGKGGLIAQCILDSCEIRYGGATGARMIHGGDYYQLELTHSEVMYTNGFGIHLLNAVSPASVNHAYIENNVIAHNETGIRVSIAGAVDTRIRYNTVICNDIGIDLNSGVGHHPIVHRNLVAGNETNGIQYTFRHSPYVSNNLLAANGEDGFRTPSNGAVNPGDSMVILNNHIVGNGGNGIAVRNDGSGNHDIANNLIAHNVGYGVYERQWLGNTYRNNDFYQNGQHALYYWNSSDYDVADINALSGAANNIDADPYFETLFSGTISSFSLADSEITDISLPFPNGILTYQFARFPSLNTQLYLILNNDGTTLSLSDLPSGVSNGMAYEIINIRSFYNTGAISDAGFAHPALASDDFLGNARVMNSSVDIGAIEQAILPIHFNSQEEETALSKPAEMILIPAEDLLRISTKEEAQFQLNIQDINGRRIAQKHYTFLPGTYDIPLRLRSIAQETYFVNIIRQKPYNRSVMIWTPFGGEQRKSM